MRGREGVAADWLTQLIESKDEDKEDVPLDPGDAIRLLATYAARELRASQPNFVDNAEGDDAIFNDEAWSSFFKKHADAFPVNEQYPELNFVEVAQAMLAKNSKSFFEVSYQGVLGHLAFELLLQRQVGKSDKVGTVEELSNELMWQVFGWDTFQGRRLIRRLSRVFFRLTSSSSSKEELPRASFTRLCVDAGWSEPIKYNKKKGQATDHPMLKYFAQATGTNSAADLIDVLYLLEIIAVKVVRPKHGLNGIFAALEVTVNDMVNAVNQRDERNHKAPNARPAGSTQS